MSERDDRMTVETVGRGDDIMVVIVVAGLILIGAFFLVGGQTDGTLINADLPKIAAPATQEGL
jgi:hypothetical protein